MSHDTIDQAIAQLKLLGMRDTLLRTPQKFKVQ